MICLGGASALEDPRIPELRVNHYAIVDVDGPSVRVNIYLPGRRLYESYDLDDLRAGRLAPPQVALKEAYSRLQKLFPEETSSGPPRPGTGTVLLHHFDARSDGLLRDAGPYGQDLAIVKGVTLDAGKFGKGCRLDATHDPFTYRVKRMPGPRGMISIWVKFDTLDRDQVLYRIGSSPTGLLVDLRVRDGVREMRLNLYDSDKRRWDRAVADVGNWQPGEWHHVVVGWDAEEGRMQVSLDGKVAADSTLRFQPDFSKATKAYIGSDTNMAGRFAGVIDELLISIPTK